MVAIPRVTTLARRAASPAVGTLMGAIGRLGIDRPFNVSLTQHRGRWVVAVRGLLRGQAPPVRAWLAVINPVDASVERLHDLSAHTEAQGIERASDPKLFRLGDELWVTCNTGTPDEGPNQIHVLRIEDDLGTPMRCIVEGRQRIEKNWAFVGTPGDVRVVHSLAPLTILRRVEVTDDSWRFVVTAGNPAALDVRRALSLGTPLVAHDGRLIGVAHQRVTVGRRRIYVGRPISVDLDAGQVTAGQHRLVHSVSSMFGSRVKRNPNLLSCTYFSGISVHDGRILLGYGVNDVSAGVADVTGAGLW